MDFLLYGSRRFSDTLEALLLDCGHRCLGHLDDQLGAPRALCTLEEAATRFDRTEVGLALAIGYADLPTCRHAGKPGCGCALRNGARRRFYTKEPTLPVAPIWARVAS